jgi:hypothetical protein
VALPTLDGRRHRADQGGTAPLPRPASLAESWGLLARVYPNAAFFVNGVEVGRGGRMESPISRNSFRPLYFVLPSNLWREDGNWLHVRIAVTPGSIGRLQPIRLGPVSALLPLVERERTFETVVPLLSVSICALLAAAFFLTARSAPPGQVALAGALLCIPIAGFSFFTPDAAIPNRFVEWLVAAPSTGRCCCSRSAPSGARAGACAASRSGSRAGSR